MSIHTDRAFRVAQSNGAIAAIDYATWTVLMQMPKRELAEIAMHLAALATGEYDTACAGGNDVTPSALGRVLEERAVLKLSKSI